MRTALLLIVTLTALTLNAQTVQVRNKTVDLSPVLKWLEKEEGERPMPHWKVIEILDVLAKEWGGYRVSAKVDGTNYHATIVLQNIPATLLRMIADDDAILKSMTELETKIAALERQNAEWERQKERTVRELSTAYEVSVAQINANNDEIARLRAAYNAQQQTLTVTSEARKSKLLAHFTGQKVGPHEVWDCGVGARVLALSNRP